MVDFIRLLNVKRRVFFYTGIFLCLNSLYAQNGSDSLSLMNTPDTSGTTFLSEIVIMGSRLPERIFRSPVSIEQLTFNQFKNLPATNFFDALEMLKGVQVITPSLGFRVINTRGFSNTTNVRFAQLIDGVDNQAPHIGAPIGNALGASEPDIESAEIIPGSGSVLYGMNSINGLVNIKTKNPFSYPGFSAQQISALNHIQSNDKFSPQIFSQSYIRYAKKINNKWAWKFNGAYSRGTDWVADNRNDLAATINNSSFVSGLYNPARDEVNGYGNESPNRKTLVLEGKNIVVARTGYRESELDDYQIKNAKGDIGIFFRPRPRHEMSLTYKGAVVNSIYQRSNRFRLQNYTLHQISYLYDFQKIDVKSYITIENTGNSYNIRSLAENMDRSFKSDLNWFNDYSNRYYQARNLGNDIIMAHQLARYSADSGRFIPGSPQYELKKNELIAINNWDYGAALRVNSVLWHNEGILYWHKFFPDWFAKSKLTLLSGFDFRSYIIIPDGNYFINPNPVSKNLIYDKLGTFLQFNKEFSSLKMKIGFVIRADKCDYFNWKYNPRFTLIYAPKESFNLRMSFQSGYRFPSIFEGFSNVNSGGVKRIGGLEIMSHGIFENSYLKSSIDKFQSLVNYDVNHNSLTLNEAIEKNKSVIQKNKYTYLKPEYIRSWELGLRWYLWNRNISVDMDLYYNFYRDFIAQVETSIPHNNNPDSIGYSLYNKITQDKYRLWTNSKSNIYNYGGSVCISVKLSKKYLCVSRINYAKLDRTEYGDGLEDGFNAPSWMFNTTVSGVKIWKNLGAAFTLRYQSEFNYISFLVNGKVPQFYTLDAQCNYPLFVDKVVFKIGATNLLNHYYYSILGGSSLGGYYYLSCIYSPSKK